MCRGDRRYLGDDHPPGGERGHGAHQRLRGSEKDTTGRHYGPDEVCLISGRRYEVRFSVISHAQTELCSHRLMMF